MRTINQMATEVAVSNGRASDATLSQAQQIGTPTGTEQKANTQSATFQGGHGVNFQLWRFGAAMPVA